MTFPLRVDPVDPLVADRQRRLAELSEAWSEDQTAAGVDGPVPNGRSAGSDYNQHVPAMDAPAAAQDRFQRQARQIMGLGD